MNVKIAKAEAFIKDILSMPEDEHKVFTPFALCDEILDKIPSLDGNILVVANLEFVYTILLRGVDRERVFFATPNDIKARAAEQMQIGGIYKYNNVITKEDVGGMKFDVVVGNPPYQNAEAATGRKTATKPLWFYFVECAFSITKQSGYVAFITPVAWIQPTSKINHTIVSRDLRWVKLFSKNPFKGVGITPSCWIAKNKGGDGDEITLNIDDTSYQVAMDRDFIPTNPQDFELKFSILSKTLNAANDKFNIRATQEHHTGSKAHELHTERTDEFRYPVFHTNSQRKWSKVKGSLHGLPKVVISKTGSLNGAHVAKDSSVTQIAVALITDTIDEAEIALQVLRSKLYRFILSITRSNSTVPSQLWRSLPAVDLSRSWTDEELYEYFNLTEEEIKLIEDTIK